MNFINRLSSKIYAYLKKRLDPKFFNTIGRSKVLRPVRDLFLRKNNLPKIVGDQVYFENLNFYFQAPIKVLNGAKSKGIEARITRVAMSKLKPGSIGVDVGANYGFITLIMAKSVKPDGKVISFEPVSHIKKVLSDNIKKNNLEENHILISQFAGKNNDDRYVTVDQVLSSYGIEKIDFIKIDVDGGDYEVLLGAKVILSQCHPPLVVEMHKNQKEIMDYLTDLGYVHFMGMNGEEVFPPNYPANLFASISPLKIPAKGSLKLVGNND